MAGERHGRGMLCLNRPLVDSSDLCAYFLCEETNEITRPFSSV